MTMLTTPALIATGLLLLLAASATLVLFARLVRALRPLLALCSADVEGLAHELKLHPAGRFGRDASAGSRT